MTFPSLRRIAVAATLGVLALCPGASAGVIGTGDVYSDPVFAGSDIVFARAVRDTFRISGTNGAVGARWVLSLPHLESDAGSGIGIRLAGAGSGRVLVHNLGLVSRFSTTRRDTLVLAPFSGAGNTLTGCANRLAVDEDALASDATRAVFGLHDCSSTDAQRVVLRDHANGVETDFPVDPKHRVSHVRLAGRYLAYTDYAVAENATTLRVFDADSHAEVTQITESGSDLGSFALQDDGAVAVCRRGEIIEYPIGGETRSLPGSECDGDLVAGAVGYLTLLPSGRPNEVLLSVYSSGRTRLVARLFGRLAEQGVPATNGKVAAFRRRFCGGWEVVTTTIGEAAARAESRCDASFFAPPRRVRNGRALLAPIACPAGCVATVTVRRPGLAASTNSVSIELTRRGRRLVSIALPRLAQRGRLVATVEVLQPPFTGTRVTDRASVRR